MQTLLELGKALDQLRGSRSYGDLDRAAKVRGDRLADSTLNNMLRGKVVPTRQTVVAFLTACGLDAEAQRPWLGARDRVASGYQRAPAGAVRVREARPRLLGVHAAIQVEPGGDSEDLPPFVPRDMGADLRTAITAAADRGGFVLLVGGSSVGKTRVLYETILVTLPEWWLVHSADADAVRHLAADPPPRTVVWLDELQRYLDGPRGIPAAAARSLIAAGAVVVATIWPTEYRVRTADPRADQPDQYSNDRELLRLAHVLTVREDFTPAERRRAEALADRRIRVALDTPDAGFTQILAAGPDLVRHWENAPADQCYGQAVITAALDARRVGAAAPLSRKFLEAATPGYLTGRQQADAPSDWLDKALTYATSPLRGATAALCRTSAGMGKVAGYTPADYLHHHALRTRRTTPLPDIAWQALVDHHHPNDTARLADNAERRGRPNDAIVLYHAAADIGDRGAVHRLSRLLAGQGRVDELRERADAGDGFAADRLARLLAEWGRIDDLWERADTGDRSAADQFAGLLAEQGRVDELRERADAGDRSAADQLAGRGRVNQVTLVLQAHADPGDWSAGQPSGRGRVDEAIVALQARADAGDWSAASELSGLLAEQGRVDELQARADAGNVYAAGALAGLLVKQGRVEEAIVMLQARADAGNVYAADRLARLLAEQGRVDELRTRADAGDDRAVYRLAGLMAEQGRVDELRARADAGDGHAAYRLAELLVEQGRVDELQARADAGDGYAAGWFVGLLARQGRVDELTWEVIAGTRGAAEALERITSQRDGPPSSSNV